jgi:predicted nucleotidyltransferase
MLDAAVLARLRDAAERLFRTRPVLAAYAFGSRVTGTPRPDSDLDVGYYVDRSRRLDVLPIAEEMQLATALSDAVGLNIDLRNLGGAPLELKGRVLEEGVRIYSGEPAARVGLERALLAQYHDYKDIFQQMHMVRLRATAGRNR